MLQHPRWHWIPFYRQLNLILGATQLTDCSIYTGVTCEWVPAVVHRGTQHLLRSAQTELWVSDIWTADGRQGEPHALSILAILGRCQSWRSISLTISSPFQEASSHCLLHQGLEEWVTQKVVFASLCQWTFVRDDRKAQTCAKQISVERQKEEKQPLPLVWIFRDSWSS